MRRSRITANSAEAFRLLKRKRARMMSTGRRRSASKVIVFLSAASRSGGLDAARMAVRQLVEVKDSGQPAPRTKPRWHRHYLSTDLPVSALTMHGVKVEQGEGEQLSCSEYRATVWTVEAKSGMGSGSWMRKSDPKRVVQKPPNCTSTTCSAHAGVSHIQHDITTVEYLSQYPW